MNPFEKLLSRLNTSNQAATGSLGAAGTYLNRRSAEAQAELETSAKRDGTAGFPGQIDIAPSQYEQQVCHDGRHWINNTAGDFRKSDALIYPRFAKARKDFREALKQYEEKKRELGGRPVNIQMKPMVYWPLMLIMALCEGGVNAIAFGVAFPDNKLILYMAAMVLAVVLVVAAHSIGAAIQQKKNLRWAALLIVLSVAMTFGLAYLRNVYIEFGNASTASIGEVGPKLNSDMVTGFFLIFNLLFIAMASWLAAKLHDEDATYEQRFKTYSRTRDLLVREKQARDGNQWQALRLARDEEGLHRRLVVQYRDLNMQNRAIKVTPIAWIKNPPEALIKVDESAFHLDDNECKFESELEVA